MSLNDKIFFWYILKKEFSTTQDNNVSEYKCINTSENVKTKFNKNYYKMISLMNVVFCQAQI